MKTAQIVFASLAGLALAAPQSPKPSQPFIEENSSICFPGQFEKCMGTKRYCESKAWEYADEPKQYPSKEACLADRVPPATGDNTPAEPDAGARRCIVKVYTGEVDADGNDVAISAPAVPCSEYWERLCKIDPDHDDSCDQCTEQCKGV